MGAWIETTRTPAERAERLSHPSWVRGLKQIVKSSQKRMTCRTLHGCVD